MRGALPLDAHAHISDAIPSHEIMLLNATIFAMTRSLDEAEKVLQRNDTNVIWGVGCHPGLVKVQRSFDPERFTALLDQTALVGEIGLDGKSRVALDLQLTNLSTILKILQQKQRLVSIHSYAAAESLIEALEEIPIKGVILHWWLGDKELTRRAISLGCFFSLNTSSLQDSEHISLLPIDRILTETDHPFGNKWSPAPQRPGSLKDVEVALASHHNITQEEMRRQIWKNFGMLVKEVGCYQILPRSVRTSLAAAI